MSTDLKDRREQLLAKARQAVEKARSENREQLDADEAKQVNDALNEVRSIDDTLKARQRTADIMAGLDAMVPKERTFDRSGNVTALGKAGDGQRLTFGKNMAVAAAGKITPPGTKGLAPSGSAVVAQEFTPDPVALGRPAVNLLSVLPTKVHTQPEFAYLRQSLRDNRAAIVPEGETKPTTLLGVERIEDRLDVIAHLSEPCPRFWFVDNEALQQFLSNELAYGLAVAVEQMALDTIDTIDGIQDNPYSTSPLVTLRKSITLLEANGYEPAAFVLHPNSWEATELLISSTNAVEHLSLPFDAATRRLYGTPVVVSNAQTEGVAHTLAAGAAAIDVDSQGVVVQWSENAGADTFAKNEVVARCEGRYACSVFSPLGIVRSDLGDGGSYAGS